MNGRRENLGIHMSQASTKYCSWACRINDQRYSSRLSQVCILYSLCLMTSSCQMTEVLGRERILQAEFISTLRNFTAAQLQIELLYVRRMRSRRFSMPGRKQTRHDFIATRWENGKVFQSGICICSNIISFS